MRTPSAASILRSLAALSLVSGLALAGPLSPPAGPVAPNGKTLTQVEPRTIINSTNTPGDASAVYVISQPGSYYLESNLAGAIGKSAVIQIKTSGVTIDLGGFGVSGNGCEYVIAANTVRDVTIRNGTVSGGGTNGFSMGLATGVHLIDVTAFDSGESVISVGTSAIIQGCTVLNGGSQAFSAGAGAVFRDCVALLTGDAGFVFSDGVAENCTALACGGAGFEVNKNSSVRNCAATGCGTGFQGTTNSRFEGCAAVSSAHEGFDAGSRAIVESCTIDAAGADGILVSDGATVRENNVNGSVGNGISAASRCVIVSNNCTNNGAGSPSVTSAGILVSGQRTRVEDNTLTQNDWGLRVTGTGNFVTRNKASGNSSVNYNAVSGNSFGIIVSATVSPAIASNTSGGGLGTTDPNANFSY